LLLFFLIVYSFIYFRKTDKEHLFKMIGVDLTINCDTEPIIDDSLENVQSQIFDSTSLKIQNHNSEIEEVSKKQERYRARTLKRLFGKDGSNRLRTVGLKRMRKEKLKDGFTTFLEWSWFFTLFIFSASYFFSWLCFAFFWHLILWLHGDLDQGHLPQFQADSSHVPCVPLSRSPDPAGGQSQLCFPRMQP
jgi:hypothetical protein